MRTILQILDLEELFQPSKERILESAAADMNKFFLDENLDLDAGSILISLLEDLVSDISQVLDSPIVQWSREYKIDNKWDLTCQCSKVGSLCAYQVVLWEERSGKDPKAYPVTKWKEYLPEKH